MWFVLDVLGKREVSNDQYACFRIPQSRFTKFHGWQAMRKVADAAAFSQSLPKYPASHYSGHIRCMRSNLCEAPRTTPREMDSKSYPLLMNSTLILSDLILPKRSQFIKLQNHMHPDPKMFRS